MKNTAKLETPDGDSKVVEKDFWECKRCDISTMDTVATGRMCPCPRGSCEAEAAGTIITTTTTKLVRK